MKKLLILKPKQGNLTLGEIWKHPGSQAQPWEAVSFLSHRTRHFSSFDSAQRWLQETWLDAKSPRRNPEEASDLVGKPLSEIPVEVWDSLEADEQDEIIEGSPLVEKFVSFFEDYYKQMEDGTSDYFLQEAMEQLDYYMGGGDLLETAKSDTQFSVEDLIESWVADGFSSDQVEEALTEALHDNNNWDVKLGDPYHGQAFVKLTVRSGLYLRNEEVEELTDGMEEAEIEHALEEVKRVTYGTVSLTTKDLENEYGIDKQELTEHTFDANPDWEKIEQAVGETLTQLDPEGEIKELSEDDPDQIIYRFPDGAYVYDVPPDELPHEGKRMGHCVGRPGMGYGRAVQRGEIKILSIRTESGRPKFTIEAQIGGQDKIVGIKQFKGKANRLPGWDLGKVGQGKVKQDEVEKAIELVQYLGLDPARVVDLEPGYEAVTGRRTNPRRTVSRTACPVGHGHGQCDGFCRPYAR